MPATSCTPQPYQSTALSEHAGPRQAMAWAAATGLALMLCTHSQAQTTLNNPLLRPATQQQTSVTPPLPANAPAAAKTPESPVQAKSLQEEVNANIQRLNAERVPVPLRILLSTVYVSAIHGNTAVLRQPIPPAQQAALAAPGTGPGAPTFATGVPNAVTGLPGSLPGAAPGAFPGAFPGAVSGGVPGAFPGATPGVPLSSGVGLVNPFAVPPPRPTSIRVRDSEPFSLQGYDLVARVREQEVTLLWSHSEDKQTIVFQSGIESPSLPAYVPPSALQERPDSGYFNRVQAGATSAPAGGSGSSGSASSSGTGAGTGAR